MSALKLRVDRLEDGTALAALRGEWDALLERSNATVFNAWEWLYPWWKHLGSGHAPWVLVARDPSGELRGLLPLALERRPVGGLSRLPKLRVRRLGFLGERRVGSDGLEALAAEGDEREVASAFARALWASRREWDLLDLTDLPEGSALADALQLTFAAASHESRVVERFVCPSEPLSPGEPFEAFLRRTARRDNYLRRRKWLERQAGFRIDRADSPDALARPMAAFFDLHRRRWAVEGGSGGIQGTRVEAFHRDALRLLAERGKLRLFTAWVGESAVASVYGISHRGRFSYFQAGYDPRWANKSVGLVLVGETFRSALAEGCTRYDFLRGTEGYKRDWVSSAWRTVALRIFRRGGVGARFDAWERLGRTGRAWAKRALPSDWVEGIRRRRREQLTAR